MIDFQIEHDFFDIQNSTDVLSEVYNNNLIEIKNSFLLLEKNLSVSMFPASVNKEIKKSTSKISQVLEEQESLEENYLENIVVKDINDIQKLICDQLALGEFKITSTLNTARFENKISKCTIKLITKNGFNIQTQFKYKEDTFSLHFYVDIKEDEECSIKMNHTFYPSFTQNNSLHLRQILDKNKYEVALRIISNEYVIQTCAYLYKLNKIRIKNKNETLKIIKETFSGTTILSSKVDNLKLQDCIDKASLFDLVLKV